MEQQILTENTDSLELTSESIPLVSISEPLQTEIISLDSQVEIKEIHEESAILLVLTEGGSLYKKAVSEGYSGTEVEWLSEVLDSKASVQFVVTTMADGYQAYASLLTNLEATVANTYASNVTLSEVLAQRDVARALEYQNLTAKIDSDILATNTTLLDVIVTRDTAISQSLSTLTSQFGNSLGRITNVEQAITSETQARTLAIQTLSSSFNALVDSEISIINETVSDATSSMATQITNLGTSFNGSLTANINTVNQAITTESQARATQIDVLRTDFLNGISAVLEQIQEVKIDVDGNTSAIDSVTATVNNPISGLSASFTRANQAWTLANNTAGAFSVIEGKVNNATTGLAATYAFAQQVLIDANNNTASAINSLRNEITSPNASWTASNNFIQSIKNTADGAVSTNTTLSSSITALNNWKTNTATVQLDSHTNSIGQLVSRAFIGVSSTAGGKATVSGLTINSVDYSLRFQGNIFELTNTSGVQQLYYDSSTGQWRFSGELVAATFKTATSGYRAEMDGSSGFPFWYGTGTKNSNNGVFYVDTAGNATMKNAIIQGALFTAFNSGYRAELADDGNYLFWIGQSTKNDQNAVFFIKKNGNGYIKGSFFQGQLMRKKYNKASAASVTVTDHITAGQPVRIDCTGYFRYAFTSTSEPEANAGLMSWAVKRNGVTIDSGSRQITRIKRDPGGEPGVNWQNIDYVQMSIMAFDNTPGSYGQNNSYTFEMTNLGYGSYSTTIATDENLVG